MQEFKREYSQFSLCGLNCSLCPRFQTAGASKCPGCGGKDFHLRHPSCAVITCNKNHDNVQFCFQCSSWPCDKYQKQKGSDSFITYKNVKKDLTRAGKNLDEYIDELNEKTSILKFFIDNFNDGRRKSFYCTAVNLLPIKDLRALYEKISSDAGLKSTNAREKAVFVSSELASSARKLNIDLTLRK
ncbi:MAG: DUF3795 domain-containing protein [Fibrobacter sp.]|nr:DUF3795 domain-containing protein [Fibrobacter sp.]